MNTWVSTHKAIAQKLLQYENRQRELDLSFNYGNHPIQIKTVNLNKHWLKIEERLKEIVVFGTS